MKQIDPYSACTTFVIANYLANLSTRIETPVETLGTATGFFWKHQDNNVYLVSNWHVFAGRDPRTGQPCETQSGIVPNQLVLAYHPKSDVNRAIQLSFSIVDETGGALWQQHKHYGQRVDVAVINLSRTANRNGVPWPEAEPHCINEAPRVINMPTLPGADVFILGYPLGMTKTALFPVWKRGSIATEFDADVDGVPSFLVDTATRKGMSGSPVIMRSLHGYIDRAGNTRVGCGIVNQFVGVYSGRHIGGIDEAQLGIIWKATLIDEIVRDPAPGDYEISA